MTIRWNWMQGTSGDVPTYNAQNDRDVLAALFDEGVIRGCTITPGTPARTVIIGTGQAIIQGDDSGNLGQEYLATITAAETVAIAAAPGSGTRVDLVGLRVQDLAAGGSAGNDVVASVVTGTVGAGIPATPASFLPICSVTISAGQTAVTSGMIADLRTWAGPKEPVGTVKLWYGPTNRVPTGWRALTTVGTPQTIGAFASFPDLAELLGVTSGNITVADVRGKALVAIDPADTTWDTLGETGGAKTVTLAAGEIPSHTHTINHDHGAATTSTESATHTHGASLSVSSVGDHRHDAGNVLGSAVGQVGRIAGYITGANYLNVASAAPGAGVQLNYLDDEPLGGSHSHTASGTTAGQDANHTHSLDLPVFTGTSGAAGSGTAHSNIQPFVALHVLLRVL